MAKHFFDEYAHFNESCAAVTNLARLHRSKDCVTVYESEEKRIKIWDIAVSKVQRQEILPSLVGSKCTARLDAPHNEK